MTEKQEQPELKNLMINCVDCHHDFVWTVGEQSFYKDRGLAQPKRCPQCRFRRRQQSQGNVRVMDGNPEALESEPPKKEVKQNKS